MSLTQWQLKQTLRYSPETGLFHRCDTGKRAGGVMKTGYVKISVLGQDYRAHHLAHLYMTGSLPSEFMDHIDGDRANNAWANLREATQAQNNQNMPDRKDNTSGYRGVFWDKNIKKWRAAIQSAGRKIHLGVFGQADEAHAAYLSAKARHHTFQPTTR